MRKHKRTNKQMIPGTHMHGRTQAHTPLCQRFTHTALSERKTALSHSPPVCERDTMRVINKPQTKLFNHSRLQGQKQQTRHRKKKRKKKITSTF